MKKTIAIVLLKLAGWKVDVSVPLDKIPKCVMVAAPHTTNWDFFYAIMSFWYLHIPMRFFIKDNYTKPWFGFLFKILGAIGVNRSQRNNLVEHSAELLEKSNHLYLLIPPEGTRSRVEKWKTGFYYIAKEAKVPVVLAYCDYSEKIAGIGKVVRLENKPKDEIMEIIQDYYKNVKGKFPENYNPKIY